jgi:DNA damage-binding protein 1
MHIVLSTLTQTHLFRLDTASRISRVETVGRGIATQLPTIALSNVPKKLSKLPTRSAHQPTYANSSYIVQITPKGVSLLEFEMGLEEYALVVDWSPEKMGEGWDGMEVICGDVDEKSGMIVVALTSARLVLLELGAEDPPDLSIVK